MWTFFFFRIHEYKSMGMEQAEISVSFQSKNKKKFVCLAKISGNFSAPQ